MIAALNWQCLLRTKREIEKVSQSGRCKFDLLEAKPTS